MSKLDGRSDRSSEQVISEAFEDFLQPSVIVELDPDDADDYGAFEETALDEDEAWHANGDQRAF